MHPWRSGQEDNTTITNTTITPIAVRNSEAWSSGLGAGFLTEGYVHGT